MVEWQQAYTVNPFGNERADLRSAMAGVTVANEIRAIASGLAGKDLGAIQVKDLMIDTLAKEKRDRERDRSRRAQAQSDNDRAAAENYYRLWSKSIRDKLKDQSANQKPKAKSKPRTRRS